VSDHSVAWEARDVSIRTGDRAPGFTLPASPGQPVDVGAMIGNQPIVLLFFPLAFSSVCTKEMCAMRDGWGAWEDVDARVFGITADSPFVTDKFRSELEIPFPILSDFNREVARRYDVLHQELKGLKDVPKRAAFVIDAEGRVVYDWVSEDPSAMPDLAKVRAALK
jgi:glutaredoxin-dependent peroxiredoxin